MLALTCIMYPLNTNWIVKQNSLCSKITVQIFSHVVAKLNLVCEERKKKKISFAISFDREMGRWGG